MGDLVHVFMCSQFQMLSSKPDCKQSSSYCQLDGLKIVYLANMTAGWVCLQAVSEIEGQYFLVRWTVGSSD